MGVPSQLLAEPARHPPGGARIGGCRARRDGRPGPLLSHGDHHRRRRLRGLQPSVYFHQSGRRPCLPRSLAAWSAPLINKKAIQAEYLSANARQLESVYNYERVVLNAFTEVINRMSMVENYGKSIEIKKQQLQSLEASVESATKLFLNARVEYVEVLLAQRDLMDARMALIETKKEATVRRRQRLSSPRRRCRRVRCARNGLWCCFLRPVKACRVCRTVLTMDREFPGPGAAVRGGHGRVSSGPRNDCRSAGAPAACWPFARPARSGKNLDNAHPSPNRTQHTNARLTASGLATSSS